LREKAQGQVRKVQAQDRELLVLALALVKKGLAQVVEKLMK